MNPMTMGEPHPHRAGQEEIWVAIDGTSLAFIGTELRVQHPVMAYMIRPDESMTHSNINTRTPVKFLWFSGSSLRSEPRLTTEDTPYHQGTPICEDFLSDASRPWW